MARLSTLAKKAVKNTLAPLIRNWRSSPPTLRPETWGLRDDPHMGLCVQGQALEQLVTRWGSPLHVVDAEALRRNARRFLEPHGHASGCEVFYSYKTNPVPAVLGILHELGIGAEVISHFELWLAQRLGVPPGKIIYNGPGKSDDSIRDAIEAGLLLININHAEEIARVAAIARQLGRRPRVGLRVTTGSGWTGQFGTPIEGGAARAAYADAIGTGVLEVTGIHAHVGGMIHSIDALKGDVSRVLDFVEEVENGLGVRLELLDFGGSLATPTVRSIATLDHRLSRAFQRPLPEPRPEQSLSIEDYVAGLMDMVRSRYAKRGTPMPRVIVEPGRSMTGNTQMLAASVISTKHTPERDFLILDAGINIAESMRSEYHHIFPMRGEGLERNCTYTVVGPICTPGDTLRYAWKSRRLQCGDRVLIMDAGGYFVPFSTSFSYPRPAIVVVDGGSDVLVRQRERFEDLVDLDVARP